jgi:divinyl protochlorophyllide a 8-vinyl-reductase
LAGWGDGPAGGTLGEHAMPSLFASSTSRRRPPGADPHAGRIGPNAILQTVAVMREQLGDRTTDALLRQSTPYSLDRLPRQMVPEGEPHALVVALRDAVGDGWCARILRDAGHRTGDYLLRHRIPRPAQWIIRLLPPSAGFATLARAMARHAWTFAGTGTFSWTGAVGDQAAGFTIAHCPMCRGLHATVPMCDFYAGTFERLLRVLVADDTVVHETHCLACGGDACRFVVQGLAGASALAPIFAHPDLG